MLFTLCFVLVVFSGGVLRNLTKKKKKKGGIRELETFPAVFQYALGKRFAPATSCGLQECGDTRRVGDISRVGDTGRVGDISKVGTSAGLGTPGLGTPGLGTPAGWGHQQGLCGHLWPLTSPGGAVGRGVGDVFHQHFGFSLGHVLGVG